MSYSFFILLIAAVPKPNCE